MNANPFMEGASLVVFFGQAKAAATPITATEGTSFSGQVATFTEPDASAPASQYTATINWGDSSSSAGTVTGPVGGPFAINGTHTYAEEGSYPVTVKITDDVNSVQHLDRDVDGHCRRCGADRRPAHADGRGRRRQPGECLVPVHRRQPVRARERLHRNDHLG